MNDADIKSRTRIAMLVWNPCINDSRVIKEAEGLVSAGFEVTVFCLTADNAPDRERRNGVDYQRLTPAWGLSERFALTIKKVAPAWLIGSDNKTGKNTTDSGRSRAPAVRPPDAPRQAAHPNQPQAFLISEILKAPFRYFLNVLGRLNRFRVVRRTYERAVKAFAPDAIHAHDLLTLAAAEPISLQLGVPFVYDTHELALHVSNPPRGLGRWRYRRLETRGIKSASAVITVSDSIADYLARDYAIERPVVLFNAPTIGETNEASRKDIRSDLKLAPDVPLAIFIGGVGRLRGTDLLVEALANLDGVHLAFVGGRKEAADRPLKIAAEKLGISDRIYFLPSVPVDQVVHYIASADIGIIPYQNVCLNHEYCMPNKLFECAAAGVPLVVASLTELKRFVIANGVGVVVDERDPQAIAEGIGQALENLDRYKPPAERLEEIRRHYTWPAQAAKLVALYRRLLPSEIVHGSV